MYFTVSIGRSAKSVFSDESKSTPFEPVDINPIPKLPKVPADALATEAVSSMLTLLPLPFAVATGVSSAFVPGKIPPPKEFH